MYMYIYIYIYICMYMYVYVYVYVYIQQHIRLGINISNINKPQIDTRSHTTCVCPPHTPWHGVCPPHTHLAWRVRPASLLTACQL